METPRPGAAPARRPLLGPPSLPPPVRAAVLLAWVEALAVAGYAVVFTVGVLPLRDPWLERLGFAAGIVVLVLASAAVIGAAAYALGDGRGWSRSFLVVAQLMAVAVAVPMVRGGDWVGWPIGLGAVALLVLLLHPATTRTIDRAGLDEEHRAG